jgi:hypothetical protein
MDDFDLRVRIWARRLALLAIALLAAYELWRAFRASW